MRVYEFARNRGIQSKEVVMICQELGIEVKAQSKLNNKQLEILEKRLGVGNIKQLEILNDEVVLTAPELETSQVGKYIGYMVSECEPFTKLGELGKKTTEFIEQTQKDGHFPVVILPKYGFIHEDLECLVTVEVGRRTASMWRLVREGVTYLFLGDEFYFNRDGIYGYEDDVARFAFFNRGVLECLPLIGMKIDEFYLNDWHTSLFALLLKTDYGRQVYYDQVKTVLNIHNLDYQGWCEVNQLRDVLGVGEEYYHSGLMRMGEAVNLLKSGIETADKICLSDLGQLQLKCNKMVASGMSAVLERNLKSKSG